MPNENLAIVRSSSARSTVEDVGRQFYQYLTLVMAVLTHGGEQDILAVLRRSVRRFFFEVGRIVPLGCSLLILSRRATPRQSRWPLLP